MNDSLPWKETVIYNLIHIVTIDVGSYILNIVLEYYGLESINATAIGFFFLNKTSFSLACEGRKHPYFLFFKGSRNIEVHVTHINLLKMSSVSYLIQQNMGGGSINKINYPLMLYRYQKSSMP